MQDDAHLLYGYYAPLFFSLCHCPFPRTNRDWTGCVTFATDRFFAFSRDRILV